MLCTELIVNNLTIRLTNRVAILFKPRETLIKLSPFHLNVAVIFLSPVDRQSWVVGQFKLIS